MAEDYANIIERILKRSPQRRFGFDCPPASEEQVLATESQLGFTLPLLLRTLYTEVGNGGDIFGDGYPLFGVVGGCPHTMSTRDDTTDMTIGQLVSRSGWRLNESVREALRKHPGAYIQCESTPDRFVSLGDYGCGLTIELDGWTSQLFIAGCGQDVHSYQVARGESPPEGSENLYMTVVSYLASSLEEWIERKLSDVPHVDVPYMPKCELTHEMLIKS